MTEQRIAYRAGVLSLLQKRDTLGRKECEGFVDVRTRQGKLVFRFDPSRMLVEWRNGSNAELIDLMPYLTE